MLGRLEVEMRDKEEEEEEEEEMIHYARSSKGKYGKGKLLL